MRRGSLKNQQIVLACNPDRPDHWVKKRADRGATRMLYSRHRDNPWLYDHAKRDWTPEGVKYMRKLDALTGVRRRRLRDGVWAAAEGAIYEEWDDAVHVVDRFDIPHEWPRYWSIDFGFVHPFVCQCWAVDPDGRLILEWEWYRTKMTNDQHAVAILDQVSHLDPDYVFVPTPSEPKQRAHHGRIWTAPRPRRIICDHDAEGRAVLQRELNMPTSAAKKTVSDGIDAVQVRMRPAGDGRPRLVLLRDAVVQRDRDLDDAARPCSTQEEIPGYVWDLGPAGAAPKDQPVKEMDDGCDTMRYMVAELDLAATTPRVRMLSR